MRGSRIGRRSVARSGSRAASWACSGARSSRAARPVPWVRCRSFRCSPTNGRIWGFIVGPMPETLRVATFNIHHAEGRDGIVDLNRTADLIADLGVDLIALQELDVHARRSNDVDQPAGLSELLNMHVHFAPTLSLDQGWYGIALAGRMPFKATVQTLPRLADEEPRAAIIASWNGLAVATTHLSRSAAARKVQTEALAALMQELGPPALVLGDLNQRARDIGP